jgi:hypothetical protein
LQAAFGVVLSLTGGLHETARVHRMLGGAADPAKLAESIL